MDEQVLDGGAISTLKEKLDKSIKQFVAVPRTQAPLGLPLDLTPTDLRRINDPDDPDHAVYKLKPQPRIEPKNAPVVPL
jgi:hypothetical protein